MVLIKTGQYVPQPGKPDDNTTNAEGIALQWGAVGSGMIWLLESWERNLKTISKVVASCTAERIVMI